MKGIKALLMKKLLGLFLIILSTQIVYPQPPARPLQVGDQLPDLYIRGLRNYPVTEASLSQIQKGKLLLIEFWATYCGTCIGVMPKMDSIQRQFGNELQVLAVTFEEKQAVQNLHAKLPHLREFSLPIATGDTLLRRYFPYRYVPHLVWVNPEMKIIAITSHEAVTAANIQSLMKGGTPGLITKKDNMEFDWRKRYQPSDYIVHSRSLFSRYDAAIGGGLVQFPFQFHADSIQRLFAWNNSLLQLFYTAYSTLNGPYINYNRVVLEIRDSSRYIQPKSVPPAYTTMKEWKYEHMYSYELEVPATLPREQFYHYMLQDLVLKTNIDARVEQKNITCWILTCAGSKQEKLLPSNASRRRINEGDTLRKMNGTTMDDFTFFLNSFSEIHPVVNKTNLTYPVDLELNIKVGDQTSLDMEALKKTLAAQGLQLKKKKHRFPVLVIRD